MNASSRLTFPPAAWESPLLAKSEIAASPMSIHFSSAVWASKIGDPVAKMVLLKMADNANDDGRCWPSVATICRDTELSERTVQGKIRVLESAGILICERGANRASYMIKMEALQSTPQELHPAGAAVLGGRSCTPTPQDMPPTPQELRLPNKEPSKNRHRTIKEPPAVDPKPEVPLPYPSKEFAEAWKSWIDHKKEIRQKMPDTTIAAQFKQLAKWGEEAAIQSIENSIAGKWQGLFRPKDDHRQPSLFSTANGRIKPPRNIDTNGEQLEMPDA